MAHRVVSKHRFYEGYIIETLNIIYEIDRRNSVSPMMTASTSLA